jgi:hypothetical protein
MNPITARALWKAAVARVARRAGYEPSDLNNWIHNRAWELYKPGVAKYGTSPYRRILIGLHRSTKG